MRLLTIVGSGRKNGNTGRVVGLMEDSMHGLAQARGIALEIERLDLGSMRIDACRGCRACFDRGEDMCPLKDDVVKIRESIGRADGVVLASPVYVEDVSGIAKNLIDRLAFNCHRPSCAGKTAYLVTTSGSGSTNHSLGTMGNALRFWGFHIAGRSKFRAGALFKTEDFLKANRSGIDKAAARMFEAMRGNKASKPSFFSLMGFRIQQLSWNETRAANNAFDYLYWKNNGWLERGHTFYAEHKAGRLKVFAARSFGDIMARFFL